MQIKNIIKTVATLTFCAVLIAAEMGATVLAAEIVSNEQIYEIEETAINTNPCGALEGSVAWAELTNTYSNTRYCNLVISSSNTLSASPTQVASTGGNKAAGGTLGLYNKYIPNPYAWATGDIYNSASSSSGVGYHNTVLLN